MKLRIPAAAPTYVLEFPKLTGGLNLRQLDYQLRPDQSSYMKNLWWQNGILQARDGQRYLTDDTSRGTGYACSGELFQGKAVFHIGDRLWAGDPGESNMDLTPLCSGVPECSGVFFQYLDGLYYKNRGGYFKISPDGQGGLKAEDMKALAFVPCTLINADPDTGAGDLYQPENRICDQKTVTYNAKEGVSVYHLPVGEIGGIISITVDGQKLRHVRDYTYNVDTGVVTFTKAPPVTKPATNNTVAIRYLKANPEAMASIMDCSCAMVAGGDRNICILMAGSRAQPNAVFWNANDQLSMNPGYFPMTTYNLVGNASDPVTGFGRQYSDIIVLKERSLGKLTFSIDRVDERNVPLFTYTIINDKVGCDLPGTICLVENNLIFCNTGRGVHMVQSSSAALENNVVCISRNVNGGSRTGINQRHIDGLLYDVRTAGTAVGWDDDTRYWLCANGRAYLWDYKVSRPSDPSWFYMTEVDPVAMFATADRTTCHLDRQGRVTRFGRYFNDYGRPIDKIYRFPATAFGNYERLKDVTKAILITRSDTPTTIRVQYNTDFETRYDSTDITNWLWRWDRMDLSKSVLGYYNVEIPEHAVAAVRKPGCRHVRHFAVTLSNSRVNEDLAIVSAQIYYSFQGKER